MTQDDLRLSDREKIRLCARAMEIPVREFFGNTLAHYWRVEPHCVDNYCPLLDDTQAMAMIKKLKLMITPIQTGFGILWTVTTYRGDGDGTLFRGGGDDATLNRAIVDCVASLAKQFKL